MLGRASAMTSGFTWDELRAICDEPEDGLLDALDEALGSQLIAERERNTYAFTHALIRATLYDELSTPRRVQLHRQIGEALENLYTRATSSHTWRSWRTTSTRPRPVATWRKRSITRSAPATARWRRSPGRPRRRTTSARLRRWT